MIAATTLALVACALLVLSTAFTIYISLPHILSPHHRNRAGYNRVTGSDDEDDSAALPFPIHSSTFTRLIIGISATLALVIAILALISSTPQLYLSRWIHVFSQVLVAFQSVLILMDQSMQRRFSIGLCIAISSLAVLCSLAFLRYHLASNSSLFVDTCYGTACCVLAITSLTLPQRPSVFYKGREVDGQHSVSALEKYTDPPIMNFIH